MVDPSLVSILQLFSFPSFHLCPLPMSASGDFLISPTLFCLRSFFPFPLFPLGVSFLDTSVIFILVTRTLSRFFLLVAFLLVCLDPSPVIHCSASILSLPSLLVHFLLMSHIFTSVGVILVWCWCAVDRVLVCCAIFCLYFYFACLGLL